MQALVVEHEKLGKHANFSKTIDELQKCIDELVNTRDAIKAEPESASVRLAKLQNETKKGFEDVTNTFRPLHASLNKYTKILDKKFKDKPLPTSTSEYDALSTHSALINRAIVMHFLREGQFDVASTFLQESATDTVEDAMETNLGESYDPPQSGPTLESWNSEALRQQFAEMHTVLEELQKRNVFPAMAWARANRTALEARGSNLEFKLVKLQYIHLFLSGSTADDEERTRQGQQQAVDYARQEFAPFQIRYLREIQQLVGAVAYSLNLKGSPYSGSFCDEHAWDELGDVFKTEFCSLLGLSANSPLYIATTAGAIALPTLLKLQTIVEKKHTEWTSPNELPVEIQLPPAFQFHSIFVCPVSKEQATDENPPVMLLCGHVIAHESMMKHSKGTRFRCIYCPVEMHPREVTKVIF